ncbi:MULTISPECIES: LysR family transcriptional regulator [unclassified Pseudomonas]|uniref:LysR family transcriptional regulator n=1 Tax=unclassified Pseudomonas TaxID=196821 RepID=UPI000BDD2F3F|nr:MULTISPECIES: LysR family transcriptional regulator [unclassified Pseudomonas]PVZ13524.1 DNA-binding transcriptional LysR family regulator [Pseudomonas sp. URIL14HWK12:I12]PVZ23830.1 DNA-binding transcriptional LysR family regulator [Pseudomonas sp. URIL14HWK12:I10]PVZ33531.1 DNA-binding transcriptional LysR family regulator [Pseudomonas sp. URIL14HWK12:I11]SNZ11936.1 DNA-binding transcriptional regulator, LysR family [Pseudomonas sp. URIL14HWK12:I9]
MMNLHHWRLLLAVADTGSFSQAARLHGVTTSAASQAVSQLEQALGSTLLNREPRPARATALGTDVIAGARRMLEAFDGIREQVAQRIGHHHGAVHLACVPCASADALAEPLQAFKDAYPQIEIVQLWGTTLEVERWLAQGAADIALLPDTPLQRQTLALGKEEWLAWVPAGHPFARRDRGTRLSLGDLAGQPFVLAHPEQVRPLFERAGLELSDVRATVEGWRAAASQVREGAGVTVLPASEAPADTNGVLQFGLAPALQRRSALVVREGAHAAVGSVLAFLQAR